MNRPGRHAGVRPGPGRHRRPWFRRPAVMLPLIAVVALLTTAGGYLAWAYEPPPDTAAAGPGYWVSTRGDDAGPGTADRPWRTVAHAVAYAPAGSRIFLRNGDYEPFTAARPGLTVTSAPGEHATVDGRAGVRDVILVTGHDVTITDLTVAGCVPKRNPDVDVPGDHGSGIRIDRTTGVTVRRVTVRDSHGHNAAGLPVGCYGILATGSRDVTVAESELYHNGAGIVITRGGRGVRIEGNDVHDQDVIVQNSGAKLDDFGGYGLAATFITDKPGPVFTGNRVERNSGPSVDYGVDGGGIELYDTANTTITGNTFADNNGVMETGTGSGGRCPDNVFTGNAATGGTSADGRGGNTGLVLRCAAGLVVRHNTFTDLDDFTFLLANGGDFAGSIDGLQIQDNTVTRRDRAVVYRLQFAAGASPAVTIDRNRYGNAASAFAVIDPAADAGAAGHRDTILPYARWRAETGFDAASRLF